MDTSAKAFDGLTYAIYKLLLVKAEKERMTRFTIAPGAQASAQLLSCINTLLAENHEGEVLTLVTAGLFGQYLTQEADVRVEVHPVNQAGASGREISDLDIYLGRILCAANELKDKPFTDTDMIHAADKTQFTINSEENIKAAQTLVDRVLVSNVQPNPVQQGGMGDWDMFMSGRLGMIPTGIWAFQTFTENCDFAWDIAVEPGSTQKATHFFSNCVVMNPETEHPEEVAEWLAWLTSSTESADIRLAAGWDLPALKDLNALSRYLEITPPDNRKAVFESLDYLVMPPVIEDYALMSDIIGQYLSAAADGTMTVTDALNAAQADCEAQITLG